MAHDSSETSEGITYYPEGTAARTRPASNRYQVEKRPADSKMSETPPKKKLQFDSSGTVKKLSHPKETGATDQYP